MHSVASSLTLSAGLLLAPVLLLAPPSRSQSAREIVERADKRMRGESSRSALTMRIIRPTWTRELGVRAWTKGDRYSMILITAPARDRGTSFLKRGNEVWQWLPSIQRVIRIPPSMMMQSWMGSDFTNDDLVRDASVVDDYDHKLLPDTLIDTTAVYRVEMIPKPRAPVVWDRVIAWIAKDEYIQRRADYYDESGRLVNSLILDDVREMGGRRIPTRWEMVPRDTQGQRTIVEYQSAEFNVVLEESFFTQQNMRRLR